MDCLNYNPIHMKLHLHFEPGRKKRTRKTLVLKKIQELLIGSLIFVFSLVDVNQK